MDISCHLFPLYVQQTLLRNFTLRWLEYLTEGIHLISDHLKNSIQWEFIHCDISGSELCFWGACRQWAKISRSASLTIKLSSQQRLLGLIWDQRGTGRFKWTDFMKSSTKLEWTHSDRDWLSNDWRRFLLWWTNGCRLWFGLEDESPGGMFSWTSIMVTYCLLKMWVSRARDLHPVGLCKIFKPCNLPVIYQGWVWGPVIYW